MPGTVDDFMRRFGGSGALDDQEAEQYYDRFASTRPEDREFDTDTMSQGTTEYLGQLPDDQFEQAAHQAYAQAPPTQQQGLLVGCLGPYRGGASISVGCNTSSGCPRSTRSRWGQTPTRGWPITPVGSIPRCWRSRCASSPGSSRPWAIQS